MASAIGTTIGTPLIGITLVDRFWLSRKTTNPPPTAQATTRAHSRLIGRTGMPVGSSAAAVVEPGDAARSATMTTSISQPAQTGIDLFMIAITAGASMR